MKTTTQEADLARQVLKGAQAHIQRTWTDDPRVDAADLDWPRANIEALDVISDAYGKLVS